MGLDLTFRGVQRGILKKKFQNHLSCENYLYLLNVYHLS